ncbi:MAG: hypothetical protein GTN36_06560, partial [Candidatus Aenigmarchaeota archaeon]|nr:hypothetical protein [Candidatus Aenigmarchaeota archaeon]
KIHKSIDNLPEKYDISILNHNNCRKIFKSQNSQDICQTEIVLNIDTSFIENNSIFEKYDIEYWFDDIYNLFKTLPNPTEIYIEKKPSYSSSKVKLNIIGKN